MLDPEEINLRRIALEQAVINARQREQAGALYPSDEEIVQTAKLFEAALRG